MGTPHFAETITVLDHGRQRPQQPQAQGSIEESQLDFPQDKKLVVALLVDMTFWSTSTKYSTSPEMCSGWGAQSARTFSSLLNEEKRCQDLVKCMGKVHYFYEKVFLMDRVYICRSSRWVRAKKDIWLVIKQWRKEGFLTSFLGQLMRGKHIADLSTCMITLDGLFSHDGNSNTVTNCRNYLGKSFPMPEESISSRFISFIEKKECICLGHKGLTLASLVFVLTGENTDSNGCESWILESCRGGILLHNRAVWFGDSDFYSCVLHCTDVGLDGLQQQVKPWVNTWGWWHLPARSWPST